VPTGDPILDSVLARSKSAGTGDPILDEVLSTKKGSTGDPILDSILHPKKRDEDLDARVGELEAAAAELGARTPEQDSPGAFRRVVDVLSRPNYAVAGAVEELTQGKGVGAALGRAGTELFSGVAGLKGQKEGFGQVLEQAGVGEGGSLSGVLPFLYSETGEGVRFKKGGALDVTARGTGGLALDIVADPLTYITFGGAGALRVTTKAGARFLNKAGRAEFSAIQSALKPELDAALQIGDAALRQKALLDVSWKSRDMLERRIAATGSDLLDRGGAKYFGHTVIPGESFKYLGDKAVAAMSMLPGGEKAIESATAFARGVEGAVTSVFSPFAKLAPLPKAQREIAKAIHRNAVTTKNAVSAQLFGEWAELMPEWRRLAKGDTQALGKKFYDAREGTGAHVFTPDEQALYDRVTALYDRTQATAVQLGILTPDEVLPGYFHHAYKNAEDLRGYHARAGLSADKVGGDAKFLREREFPTYKAAVDSSREQNRLARMVRAAGKDSAVYPELIPEYDVMQTMASYIHQFSDTVARKQWRDEAVAMFGRELTDLDNAAMDAVFDMATPRSLKPKERWYLDRVFSGFKTLRQMEGDLGLRETTRLAKTSELTLAEKNYRKVFDAAPLEYVEQQSLKNLDEVRYFRRRGWDIVEEGDDKYRAYRLKTVTGQEQYRWRKELGRASTALRVAQKKARRWFTRDAGDGWDRLVKTAHRLVPRLSDDGKREFFRELYTRVNSGSQFAQVVNEFGDKYGKFLPAAKVAPTADDIGKGVVTRTGALWGDGEKVYHVPQEIADDIENFSSMLFRSKDFGPGIKRLVDGWDKANNWFKIGSYTFWPASLVRDVYNNYAQTLLDIGVGAFARPMETARLLTGKGKIRLAGAEYEAKALRQAFFDAGIMDRSGRSFAQIIETGGAKREANVPGRIDRAVAARGSVENWTRAQYALNLMARGADLQSARDQVSRFLFNYSELSPAERELFRRMIPFYTFPRKAIELHIRALGTAPGRLAAELKPFRGREDENGQMTSWEGNAFKLRLDRDGKTVSVLTGIDLPIKTLDVLWRGSFKGTVRQALGMASPLLKAPVELASGRSLFTGRDMTRAQSAGLGRLIETLDPPEGVKNWLGYKKEMDPAGRPRYTFDGERFYVLFQSWILSRLVSTTDRQFRTFTESPEWGRVFLNIGTGLLRKDLNLDEEKDRRMQERIRQLEEAMARRGAYGERTVRYELRQ
jgi:hypothetical protein